MHTGAVSPHSSGLTQSIAHARSLSAFELQTAVAEAQSLAAQAAEAQNRVQQVAQVASQAGPLVAFVAVFPALEQRPEWWA